jgi:hypothetical protein
LWFSGLEGLLGRGDLAGAAHLELVSGVAQLRPEDAMLAAMLRGWRAQQASRGLREDTMAPRDRLVRRFLDFSGEYPWRWGPGHVEEWTLSLILQGLDAESELSHAALDAPPPGKPVEHLRSVLVAIEAVA